MARQYPDNGYPSVTEVLNVLRKPGLENWFKVNTVQFCNEESRRGREIGTQIHDVIQQYIEGKTAKVESAYPDEVMFALESFMKFRHDYPALPLHRAEMSLTSEVHKFNGTLDALGDDLVFDWKSCAAKGNDEPRIFPEWLYQVSAYVYLYNEVNKSNIERAMIVAIAKDKVAYSIHHMDKAEIDACFNEVFLSCLKIKNYQRGGLNGISV